MVERKLVFHKSCWIHMLDRRVLVVRSQGNSVFFLPGGGPERGETGKDAVIREVREELSVDLDRRSVRFVSSFTAPSFEFPETIPIRMRCYFGRYLGSLKPASEIEEMSWFRHADREKTSPVDQLVLDFLKRTDQIA